MSEWRNALERLEGAYSDHTLRGYAMDMQQFQTWCIAHGHIPLPASAETLVEYVTEEGQRLLPSTLGRRLCGIARIHRLLRYADPSKDEDVRLAVRRARRKKPSRPRQALGVTTKLRDRLIDRCSDDLIGLRDEILVRVGFDTLCRRAELVGLRVEDLIENERGNLSILVRRAKNDQTGEGRVAPFSTKTSERVRHWLDVSGIEDGTLLRPIYRDKVMRRFLDPVVVSRVLKKLMRCWEQDAILSKKVSGHSLRVGAAQQLTLDGHGAVQVMRAGGWRSMNVVARYIENVDLDLWA
jgi:integrase/recombinase XerD